jgi:hypothetical protein
MRLSRSTPVLSVVAVMAVFLTPPYRAAFAVDSATRAIRVVMEENLAACNEEDMPRLLKTMSQEMPNRELFIAETKKEWAASDSYARLDEIEVLKHSNAPRAITRLPYATVRVVQTTVQSGERKSDEPPTEWAKRMVLAPGDHTVEYETLWKKEGGKWRMVAGLTEPRPQVVATDSQRK